MGIRSTATKPRAVKMEVEEADTSVYESTRIHEVNENPTESYPSFRERVNDEEATRGKTKGLC